MPELNRFYGIVIKMYFGDHEAATSTPNTLSTGPSSTSKRSPSSVEASAARSGLGGRMGGATPNELRQAWQKAKKLEPAGKIDPLP